MSDKSDEQEFGLTQEEIFAAMRPGKLQFRECSMHGNPWCRLLEGEVIVPRQKDTDKSDQAYREVARVLEEAVRVGANSLGMEYEGRDLIVYYNFGNSGRGAARIPKELQQNVIEEIVQRAGLSRKSKGKIQVQLFDRDYEAVVQEYDSFGESAFTITLKEKKKRASR